MKLTEELLKKLREIKRLETVKINGENYLVLENEVLPEAKFDLKAEVERKEEGFELFLIKAGTRPPETDFLDADFRLRCFDSDVEYVLLETKEGTENITEKYDKKHSIKYDYDAGKTLIYKSTYMPKDIKDVKIKFVTIEEEEIPIESLEIID